MNVCVCKRLGDDGGCVSPVVACSVNSHWLWPLKTAWSHAGFVKSKTLVTLNSHGKLQTEISAIMLRQAGGGEGLCVCLCARVCARDSVWMLVFTCLFVCVCVCRGQLPGSLFPAALHPGAVTHCDQIINASSLSSYLDAIFSCDPHNVITQIL